MDCSPIPLKASLSRLAALASLLLSALMLFLLTSAPPAFAGSLKIGSDGSSATITAPLSVKYSYTEMANAMWNHGTFYVYFFQGASGVETTLVKRSGSDIKTSQVSLKFTKGVSWAKVHVAAVDSSTASNGGKYKRLKSGSGSNISFCDWLLQGQRFYVWISDSGGDAGSISLRGTQKVTVYANGSTFKNVEAITLTSQPASSHWTQGQTESAFKSVLNIPFRWDGKEASQVPFKALNSRGVGNNDNYVSFYRMAWKQYTSGTTYSGYSPYKLQHGETGASNLWTSVNLASIGICVAQTYTDETYQVATNAVFRNTESSLICCLRAPKEQLKLNTDGGVLTKGSASYEGSAVNYKKAACETTVSLPKKGYKKGRDGSTEGYVLTGYAWASGTKRSSFASTTPSSSKSFISFDQASPQSLSAGSPTVTLCNSWQLPAFGPENLESDGTATLKAPTVATVTYKAVWEALPFTIHYIVNGQEVDSEVVPYDQAYTLKSAPSGSGGWSVRTQDGKAAAASGFMPAADIFASAETPAENCIRYYVDDTLVASYEIPFGTEPLTTTYVGSHSGGVEFNNDGVWQTESASFTATYKEHYNVPKQVPCSHLVPQQTWVPGSKVTVPVEVEIDGVKMTVMVTYVIDGYYIDTSYYEHDYDMEDDYSPYNVCTYSASFSTPSNPHGGTWHGWFVDKDYTTPAQSSYSFTAGSSLSFYSYTDHSVSFIVNSEVQLEQTKRYGEVINPYAHGDDLNPFGGELECWFSDEACTARHPSSVKVGSEDLVFYGYTTHTIHLWMDAGTKAAVSGDYEEAADADEETDDGSSDIDPDEAAYCRYELSVRYGDPLVLPTDSAASSKLTRPGCEDWSSSNGVWFVDPACTVRALDSICAGDATYYSYNVVKLTYDLSTYAEQLDESQVLRDASTRELVSLHGYLPAPELLRYGTVITPEGDGSVYWSTDGGLTRSAMSVRGGFLNKGATGSALKEITLTRSLTVYKDWAQGLFDGIVTN